LTSKAREFFFTNNATSSSKALQTTIPLQMLAGLQPGPRRENRERNELATNLKTLSPICARLLAGLARWLRAVNAQTGNVHHSVQQQHYASARDKRLRTDIAIKFLFRLGRHQPEYSTSCWCAAWTASTLPTIRSPRCFVRLTRAIIRIVKKRKHQVQWARWCPGHALQGPGIQLDYDVHVDMAKIDSIVIRSEARGC
jgi:hypothetical protein